MPAPATMTEAELCVAVIDLARTFGWRVAHFRPCMTKHGWRTAVQGDGKGFPDLCLAHEESGRLIFAELKVGSNKLSEDQEKWKVALTAVETHPLQSKVSYAVWRPSDWKEIVRILSFGAAHG